jgi:hypothetical protein
MKLSFLSLCLINSDKIIKNINLPSCKNCIYYKPDILHNDFTSTYNKCEKFGEKDIITDEITYNYADSCRSNENMCGNEGKYFEEEKNIKFKIAKYKIITNLPFSLPIILLVINLLIKVLLRK